MAAHESSREELELTIPWMDVEKEANRVVNNLKQQARIPGFRKGKAPPAVLRARFKAEIRQEVLEELVPKTFWKEAQEKNLNVVGSPDITDLHFEEGEDLRFKAEFEVIPEFELGEYRGITVAYTDPDVSDEDVDGELQALREQHVSFRNLDPRPLEDGDLGVVALKSGEVEGVPPIEQEETTVTIGAEDTLPGFTEALRGKSPGDEVDFEVKYPDDFGNEQLAGKTVPFHASVKALREKELPELDDDFASDVGDFRTLDELKSRIRENVGEMRRHHARERAKEKIVDTLVDQHSFPVPHSMIDQQIRRRVERNLQNLQQQGVDIKDIKLDWKKVHESEHDAAERDVRAGLLLERIAMVENLTASEKEIDAQVERYAKENQLSVAGARKKLAEEGALDRLQSRMKNEKALNFLFDEAEKVEPEEKDEVEPEATDEAEAVEETKSEDSE